MHEHLSYFFSNSQVQLVLDWLLWCRITMQLSQVCHQFAKHINHLMFSVFFSHFFHRNCSKPFAHLHFRVSVPLFSKNKSKLASIKIIGVKARLSVENSQCAVYCRIVTSCASIGLFFFFSFFLLMMINGPKLNEPPYFPAARFPMRQKAKLR